MWIVIFPRRCCKKCFDNSFTVNIQVPHKNTVSTCPSWNNTKLKFLLFLFLETEAPFNVGFYCYFIKRLKTTIFNSPWEKSNFLRNHCLLPALLNRPYYPNSLYSVSVLQCTVYCRVHSQLYRRSCNIILYYTILDYIIIISLVRLIFSQIDPQSPPPAFPCKQNIPIDEMYF